MQLVDRLMQPAKESAYFHRDAPPKRNVDAPASFYPSPRQAFLPQVPVSPPPVVPVTPTPTSAPRPQVHSSSWFPPVLPSPVVSARVSPSPVPLSPVLPSIPHSRVSPLPARSRRHSSGPARLDSPHPAQAHCQPARRVTVRPPSSSPSSDVPHRAPRPTRQSVSSGSEDNIPPAASQVSKTSVVVREFLPLNWCLLPSGWDTVMEDGRLTALAPAPDGG